MMMIIAPNSRARKGEKERGEYGGIWEEEERNADYGEMMQPSQQHVAPCVKGVEWGWGTRGLGMLHTHLIAELFWRNVENKNDFFVSNLKRFMKNFEGLSKCTLPKA